MKQFIALTLALTSLSAFSATEFYTKYGKEECTIAKNKVTTSVKVGNGEAGFTKTSSIEVFGLDEIVAKAVSASTGRTSITEFIFNVKVDGKTSTLNFDDSKEAGFLISFISKACK